MKRRREDAPSASVVALKTSVEPPALHPAAASPIKSDPVAPGPGVPMPNVAASGTVLAYIAYSTPFPARKQPTPKVWAKWACAFCGSSVTPERRAGPTGRNTLCNACGIKYHKAQKATKQRQEDEKRSIQSRMSMNILLNSGEDELPPYPT